MELFDTRHARSVLTKFGPAYDCLPDGELTGEQATFVDRAIEGLADDGKVICVRLAFFADMIKSKHWTSSTLKRAGGRRRAGASSLGGNFFRMSSAPAAHRYHRSAAQSVLQAALPAESILRHSGEWLTQSEIAARWPGAPPMTGNCGPHWKPLPKPAACGRNNWRTPKANPTCTSGTQRGLSCDRVISEGQKTTSPKKRGFVTAAFRRASPKHPRLTYGLPVAGGDYYFGPLRRGPK